MTNTTHTVPWYRAGIIKARVAKLSKAAVKLGMAPLACAVSAPRVIVRDADTPAETRELVCDVVLSGEVPRVPGFALVARLTHLDGGTVTAKAPGVYDIDLDAWRNAGPRCQHCGLSRGRADTFIVRDEASGGMIQVGRSCLADYTRSTDALALASFLAMWGDVTADGDDDAGPRGRRMGIDTLCLLAAAVACVRVRGFRKSGSDGSTRDAAMFVLGPPPRGAADHREWSELQPTEADVAKAEALRAWTATLGTSNDYENNLRVVCAGDDVPLKLIGIAVSAPAAYDRAMGREAERKARTAERPANAGHFGTVGERFSVRATVEARKSYESAYGTGYMLILRSEAGHVFKTFTTGAGARGDLGTPGTAVTLRGTVKAHETDRRTSEPVTVLSRVELASPDAPPPAPRKARKPKPSALEAAVAAWNCADAPLPASTIRTLDQTGLLEFDHDAAGWRPTATAVHAHGMVHVVRAT